MIATSTAAISELVDHHQRAPPPGQVEPGAEQRRGDEARQRDGRHHEARQARRCRCGRARAAPRRRRTSRRRRGPASRRSRTRGSRAARAAPGGCGGPSRDGGRRQARRLSVRLERVGPAPASADDAEGPAADPLVALGVADDDLDGGLNPAASPQRRRMARRPRGLSLRRSVRSWPASMLLRTRRKKNSRRRWATPAGPITHVAVGNRVAVLVRADVDLAGREGAAARAAQVGPGRGQVLAFVHDRRRRGAPANTAVCTLAALFALLKSPLDVDTVTVF